MTDTRKQPPRPRKRAPTKRTANARKERRDWKRPFLAALEEGHTIVDACRVAGIARTTAYEGRQRDEAFALAWADLEEKATEKLEAEAYNRALGGSDRLMEFLLKARRPDKYRDRVDHTHAGELTVTEPRVVVPTTKARRAEILASLEAATTRKDQ